MATKSAQLETVPSSPPSATKMAQNQKTPIDSSSHALAKKKKQASKSTWRKEPLDCPLFLRKAYHMIDTCDPAVAGWTEDGDMFVVKDPEIFASTIIPQFFKHNNFASFVRQLNFYGFRKVKCDPIKLDTPVDEAESKYWRFRHRNFQKDRLDLLNSMRRKDPNAPAPEQGDDVTELKTEVTTLRTCIDTMSKDIDKLTSFMENMMMKDKEEENDKREECSTTPENDDLKEDVKRTIAGIKKRKVVNLLPNLATASDSDFVMEDVSSGVSVDQVASSSAVKIEPVSTSGRGVSFTSITSSDQEFVNELFTDLGIDDSEDDAKPIPPLDPLDAQITSDVGNDAVDPRLMRKLHDALALLPKDLQELFVDRLVVAITNPDACQSQLDAIMALSAAASDSTSAASNQKREDSLVALPLAAAKLSAILAQYGHGHKGLPVVPVHA